jgi:hypothetical protein
MICKILGIAVVAGLVQTASAVPTRLGFSGDRFTADDLHQIDALARDAGGTVWIVTGEAPSFVPGRWWGLVFLRPDHIGGVVRRGRAFSVSAAIPTSDAYDVPKTWRREGPVRDYAQVAVQAQNPDAISGNRDVARPFLVTGLIDDDSLAALVAMLRTSPRYAGAAVNEKPVLSIVDGSSPIASIISEAGADVRVGLIGPDLREKEGQSVQLRHVGTQWTVTGITFWIAD